MKVYREQPYLIGFFILFMIFIFACNLPGQDRGTATIRIDTGSSSGSTNNPFAGQLPSDLSTYELTVTGPDMEDAYAEFPASTPLIMLVVPAGTDRFIELVANVLPASPGAIISYRGSTTVDLVAGETVDVYISMGISKTKLVFADPAASGTQGLVPKIVQMDDMSGTGWIEIIEEDISSSWPGVTFLPYDLDLDNQGRIYVTNAGGATGEAIIWRIDNMSDLEIDPLIVDDGSYITISIDRANGLMYYASTISLHCANLDGSSPATLNLDIIQTIKGIFIAENGYLYVAGEDSTGGARIFQYDPAIEAVVTQYGPTNLSTPWDVLVKDDYVYCTNAGTGVDNWQIIRLSLDLTAPVGFGINVNDSAGSETGLFGPGEFYSPRNFIAVLNRKITVTDDDDGMSYSDKIVSMDNISGDNWETFPNSGPGSSYFDFYSC